MSELVSDGGGRGETVVLDQSAAGGRADGAKLGEAKCLTAPSILPRGLADPVPGDQQRHVVQSPGPLVLVQSPLPLAETGQHLRGGHLAMSLMTEGRLREADQLDGLHSYSVTDTRVSEDFANLTQSTDEWNK